MALLPVTAAEMDARHRHQYGARGLRGQGSGRLMWRCGANRGAAFRPPGAGGHGGRESVAPLPFRRGTGGHAARYVLLCNQHLPQSDLGSKTPLQAMKDWRKMMPELFRKQPYHLPGCDT